MEALQLLGATEEEQDAYEDQQWAVLNAVSGDAAEQIASITNYQLGSLVRGMFCEADHGNWDSCTFAEVLGAKWLLGQLGLEIKTARELGGLDTVPGAAMCGEYGLDR